ncbi:MAG TPA: MerR family transcriptional regulator [Gemmatimonadaceae bacterium]|jgi:DNA-binding transcriptional MerR regulator/methylmalonyl-CoA mutase cobalamin-binding subunit|nr:MerR family transcriptional regulator [Gemmatimonadaceae bacterium]
MVDEHPIGVAAERTGISPHVLRVWERRYRAIEPTRTDGGRRLYSDADIERLRLMALATAAGRGISQVAKLPTKELARLVRDDEEARRQLGTTRRGRTSGTTAGNDVVAARARARALDAVGLERVLRRSAALVGASAFLDTVATPLLKEIGDQRSAGELAPGEEQLVLVALRRVIEGIVPVLIVSVDAPNLLVATPVGDRQEIEAVMATAGAAIEGWRVTYLGPGVPVSEIAVAAASTSARAVSVTVPRAGNNDLLLQELRALRARLAARVPLLAGGAGALEIAAELRGAGVQVIEHLTDLRLALRVASQSET